MVRGRSDYRALKTTENENCYIWNISQVELNGCCTRGKTDCESPGDVTAVAKLTLPILPPQGILQLGKNPHSTSPKDWKAFLFVLKHDQELKKSSLDYYKDGNKRWQKQDRKGSIVLWPYFQVSLAHECSYQYPIKITDPNNKDFYVAAGSFEVMNKWCNSLQRQSYLVKSSTGEWEL